MNKRSIQIWVSAEQHKQLKQLALDQDTMMATLIKQWITKSLAEADDARVAKSIKDLQERW